MAKSKALSGEELRELEDSCDESDIESELLIDERVEKRRFLLLIIGDDDDKLLCPEKLLANASEGVRPSIDLRSRASHSPRKVNGHPPAMLSSVFSDQFRDYTSAESVSKLSS